jgi:hypothetical protein
MLQAAISDCVSFDPFSFQQDLSLLMICFEVKGFRGTVLPSGWQKSLKIAVVR